MKLARWSLPALLAIAACAQAGMGGGPVGGSSSGSNSPAASGASSGSPGPSSTATPAAFAPACTKPSLGAPLLRLLTQAEFNQTIADIFPSIVGQWTSTLPADTVSSFGFDNDSSATVGNQQASDLLATALSIATAVTGTSFATILPCSAAAADRTCAETYLMQYGRRLFRRPLATAEHDRYMAFFDSSLTKGADFKTAVKWMTVGLIQSPLAVYRSEIGVAGSGGTRALSPYEVATELAYTYAGSTPTDDLLTKAGNGTLGDPVALAKSLLTTAAGKQTLQAFFGAYLNYTKVTSVQRPPLAAFAGVSADMVRETQAFVDSVVFQKGGGLKDLLTAPTTNPSVKLAQYYGFPAPPSDYASIARPSGRGIGILAQGSFLASDANSDASSPTQRGLFPFAKLLCHTKPNPPPNVPPIGAAQPGVVTTRQRYEQQHAQGSCASCHKLFDPIGFGFEHYDEGGKYRDTESGLPINSAASVPNLDGTPLFSFTDEEGLVTGLANQPVVYQCFASYLATYAFGTGEQCLGASHVSDLQAGRIGIADAFAAFAAEPHFTQRATQ